jgi:hypothetical protein
MFIKPFADHVDTLETLILTFVPSATFWYDPNGHLVIYTNLMTDEDGNLIAFEVIKND